LVLFQLASFPARLQKATKPKVGSQESEGKPKTEISRSIQHSAFSPRNILALFCPASFPAKLQKEKRS
jgi:hypothetical protein